ncbi:Kunitz/Bovine pancreatic trypsin inhibitor domain protein [Dictyocaulus viviparus]|uniref:Kunitz/Bovine pancreatic trypsin inhibitor domain protein n=1 Tax=Dictyocaulus viviparus TaxID=29172 RepID=A0A0D8XWI3_DICVI|nr:Kunitz/Bovine pancreatic trypsin inhibitor domain protein [Dictyocaulus viviparus]
MFTGMICLLILLPLILAENDCLLGRDSGDSCDQPAGQRFYFDLRTKKCQPFYYKNYPEVKKKIVKAENQKSTRESDDLKLDNRWPAKVIKLFVTPVLQRDHEGCGGNQNRFNTSDVCMKTCANTKSSTATAIQALCKSGAYSAGATSLIQPLSCSECPKGYECENEICCPKKEYLCNLQYDAGKFGDRGSHKPRYFYSKSFKNCMLFTFYGRDGNANNFETYNECKAMCMS